MSTGSEAMIAGRNREVVDPDDAELRMRCHNRLTRPTGCIGTGLPTPRRRQMLRSPFRTEGVST